MHSLIIGMTESGKTTLAKILCKKLTDQGKTTIVLDTIYDPGWTATYKVSSAEELSSLMLEEREAYIFIDEGGEVFSDGRDTNYSWFATRSRHYGHSVFFMAQRAILIPKTMRDQCSRLFLFTSSASDGGIHAEEWNKEILYKCNGLPQFQFFMCDRYGLCKSMKIENYKDIVNVSDSGTSNSCDNVRGSDIDNGSGAGKVDKSKRRKRKAI